MHIYLYGPSGSGKSTVGKLLAQALKLPFLDLDTEIENVFGQSIPNFINEKGEEAFRNLETSILNKSAAGAEKVIALGGGTLLREENNTLAQTHGQVVFLKADLSILSMRLALDTNQRPLLTGELKTSLKSLLKERQAHYTSFPMCVDASLSPDQVAWNIQRQLGRYHLRKMGPGYDVLIQAGNLEILGKMLNKRRGRGPVLVVSDTNVAPLYSDQALASLQAAGYTASKLVIPAGEAHKTIETVSYIWRGCLDANLDRKSTIIALGGGVVNDMAGFAAATFMRGCRWVAIPTTVLAMVDASIGGKTGFNLPQGKNLVGAFYPPLFVLADPNVLSTLPERFLRAGLSEVVKHSIIADPDLFSLCSRGWEVVTSHLAEVIRHAIAVKVKVIEEDPFEEGFRAALNFGHTIGHAVELASKFKMLHGEAVAVGMVAEAKLAERLSIAEIGLSYMLAETLSGLELPVEIPKNLPNADLIHAMKMDKKKSEGIIRFSLPVKIGEVIVGYEINNLTFVLEVDK